MFKGSLFGPGTEADLTLLMTSLLLRRLGNKVSKEMFGGGGHGWVSWWAGWYIFAESMYWPLMYYSSSSFEMSGLPLCLFSSSWRAYLKGSLKKSLLSLSFLFLGLYISEQLGKPLLKFVSQLLQNSFVLWGCFPPSLEQQVIVLQEVLDVTLSLSFLSWGCSSLGCKITKSCSAFLVSDIAKHVQLVLSGWLPVWATIDVLPPYQRISLWRDNGQLGTSPLQPLARFLSFLCHFLWPLLKVLGYVEALVLLYSQH